MRPRIGRRHWRLTSNGVNTTLKPKVFVAMSGGVDSSVAAKLMQDQGHKTIGVFLHFWKEEGIKQFENKCCSAEAFLDASRVCHSLGIPLYTMNFSRVFKKEIVDNFINEYKRGSTPNPCARCNKLVKLGLLIERARKLGFDYVASGHYARIKKARKQKSKKASFVYKLFRAKDKEKDQSYFLYNLTQERLKHLIFPLGEFKKKEVREMARKFKLPVSEKKDSQEVCFIPEKSHNEFLRRHIKMNPGPIKLLAPLVKGGRGVKIGKHQGLPLYTIGQRKGVEIGGTGPYYAAKFDYKKNILYVVNDAHDKALYSDHLVAKNVNWISGIKPKMPFKCEAVIRYHHKPVKCKIITPPNPPLRKGREKFPLLTKEGVGGGFNYLVKFNQPQRAVTPGQSVVFYKGDEMLGGGVIK
jgi:tRNA-specific 2-thiouridylase